MIEILANFPVGCLVVHYNAEINDQERQEWIDALALAEELIARGKQVSLVVDLTDLGFFNNVEVARIDSNIPYGEVKQIYRIAIVGNQKWIEWFTRLVGPFTQTKEMHFPESQLEAACEWACAKD